MRDAVPGEIVAEHSRFNFQLAESVFHHVADGHNAKDVPVIANNKMSNAVARHSTHDGFDRVIRIAEVGSAHGVLDKQVPHRTQVTVDGSHDISLANEADDCTVACNNRHSADVMTEEKTNRVCDSVSWTDSDDALVIDQISNVHFLPPRQINGYS
jgi:hypothetical protein